jgi:hypothetical protein
MLLTLGETRVVVVSIVIAILIVRIGLGFMLFVGAAKVERNTEITNSTSNKMYKIDAEILSFLIAIRYPTAGLVHINHRHPYLCPNFCHSFSSLHAQQTNNSNQPCT